jgi:hypothetical protein
MSVDAQYHPKWVDIVHICKSGLGFGPSQHIDFH